LRTMGKIDCPRCGEQGYIYKRYRGNKVYVYCRHPYYEGGVRRERKCYLGAEQYTYVEKFNPLGLTGAMLPSRFERYALNLISQLSEEELRKLRDMIDRRLKSASPLPEGGEDLNEG